MKRGLITWNPVEMPPEAFAGRLEKARALIAARHLPALVLYTDLWRSNGVRRLTNFMPYWSRSLLVVPASGDPVLICGLAARGYPWIRAVTTLQDIRPAKQLGQRLVELAGECSWQEVGIVDLPRLPYDIRTELAESGLRIVDVAEELPVQLVDPAEMALRRRSAEIARRALLISLSGPAESAADRLAAIVERACRLAGAADVHVWIGDGISLPRPSGGRTLSDAFSVTIACDYLGHWVIVSRVRDQRIQESESESRFHEIVRGGGLLGSAVLRHDLSCADSWIAHHPRRPFDPGSIVAIQIEHQPGSRLFYGDTCRATGPSTAEPI